MLFSYSAAQEEIFPSYQVDFGTPGTSSYLNPAVNLGGYWESEESGIYFFKDVLVVFNIDSVESSYFGSFINGLFQSFSLLSAKRNKDTLLINTFSETFREKIIFELILIDENHIRIIDSNSKSVLFVKKALDPYSIISSLGILNEITNGEQKSKLKILEDFKRVETFSRLHYMEGSFKYEDTQYWIYNDFIYHGSDIYEIKEIYAHLKEYIVVVNRKRRNQPRVFHLEVKKKSGEPIGLYLKKFSLHSFSSNKHEGSLFTKWQDEIVFESLPEIFFERYYPHKEFVFKYSSNPYFEIQKDKKIYINGKYWEIGRIWSSEYHPGYLKLEEIENYTLLIDIKDPKEDGRRIINAFVSEGQIKFYIGGNPFRFKTYTSFMRLIQNIFSQIFGFIASILVLGFLIYRIFILPRKFKQRLVKSQLEGIKSQLNPHFLFNSMASIQSLMNQNKISEANRYQAELSDLLRYHLDAGAEDMVLLSEELSALQHYLELENLRSPFSFSFEIDTGINPDLLEIPNQILQPLVENAIKHGLRFSDDPKLLIRVQKLEKRLHIFIVDNGPGINSSEKLHDKHPTLRKTHKGLALIQEKISLLKKKGLKLKLNILDRRADLQEDESGTQVELEFSLVY